MVPGLRKPFGRSLSGLPPGGNRDLCLRSLLMDGTAQRSRIGSGVAGGFRADIEGLRAVAVLAVVLFHAAVPWFGGGFVGVDVFFVVSGFLITRLLWHEAEITGTVRLARFYGARARRLLPAAGTVVVATAIGAAILLPPLQARDVLGDGIASALYVGNYLLAVKGTDYLAADAPPSPFQHYWSLGAEEQFYLLWPALVIGAVWLARGKRRSAGTPSVRPCLVILAALAAASLVVDLAWTRAMPSWAFFSLPTRAWELAVGGLVALSAHRWSRMPSPVATMSGWAGLALVIAACTTLDSATPYPGTAALLPVLGTALVIAAGCVTSDRGVGRVLSLPPLRALGRVSYSWYLWHWPVLLLAPPLLGHPLGPAGRLIAVALSGGLAVLTLHLIENPGRLAARLRRSAGRSLTLGAAVSAAAAGVSLVLLVRVPVPVGHGVAAAPTLHTTPQASSTVDPREAAVRQVTAQAQDAVAASARLSDVPANLSPSLADAPGDKAAVFVDGCMLSWLDVDQPSCVTGDPASPTTVALVGDSHAAMWNPAFESLAQRRHWRLETLSKVTCPLLDLPISSPYLGRTFTECEQWREGVQARLRAEHPRMVVLSMARRYGQDFGFTSYDRAWLSSLTRTVARIRSTGATVLVLGPVPDPHSTVPTCLSAHLDSATACSPPRSVAVNDAGNAAEAAATAAGGGQYVDLTALFCTADRCPVIVGNALVFRDDNHLTTRYAQVLSPAVGAFADRALALPSAGTR